MPAPTGDVLFLDTPDSRQSKWTSGTPSLVSGEGPWGGYTWRGSGAYITFDETTDTLVAGMWLKFNFLPQQWGHNMVMGFYKTDSGNNNTGITTVDGGSINARRGNATIASSAAGVLKLYTWHYIEIMVTARNTTTGKITVWVDGDQVIDFEGNTGSVAAMNSFFSDQFNNYLDRGSLVVAKSTTPIGPNRVVSLLPTDDDGTPQWTQGAGSGDNWERVDEAVPDGDTSYVHAYENLKTDDYVMADMPAGDWDVLAVAGNLYAKKAEPGANWMRSRISQGVATTTQMQSVPSSYTTIQHIAMKAAQPDTDWTLARVNDLRVGMMIDNDGV